MSIRIEDVAKTDFRSITVAGIIAGKRGITADTDLRLCRFFGLTDGLWLRLQGDYDMRLARAALAKKLAKIKPWSEHLGAKAS